MSLIKYDPVDEFDAITRKFDNLVSTFRPAFESALTHQQKFSPKVDIHEDEKNLYFEAELPGLKRSDVKVSVSEDKYLIIQGERHSEQRFEGNKETAKIKNGNGKHNGKRQPVRVERSYGSFIRTFTLPENTDASHINATFKNGILEIKVPRKEPTEPKRIDVDINVNEQ